jgi:hypothetical protein
VNQGKIAGHRGTLPLWQSIILYAAGVTAF